MADLKAGTETTEWKGLKVLVVVGVAIAIAGAVGNVPFTPDQATAWFQAILAEGAKWTAALTVPVGAALAWYQTLRTSVKKAKVNADKEVEIAKASAE